MDIDGPCYYCQQPTNSLAGNPGLWPLRFPHPDNSGIVRIHHTQCVVNRLRDTPCPACGGKEKICATCGIAMAVLEASEAAIDKRDEWWTKALRDIDVRVSPVTGENGKSTTYKLESQASQQKNWLVQEMKRLGIEDQSTDHDFDIVLVNARAEAAEKTLKDLDKLYKAEVERNGKAERSIEIDQEAMNIGIESLKAASQSLDQSEMWRDKMHTAICVALQTLRLKPEGDYAVRVFQDGYKEAVRQMAGYDWEKVVALRKGLPTPMGLDQMGKDQRVMESTIGWKNLWMTFRQRFCKHFWRPAITSKGPAKMCDYCTKVVKLTQEEFYAEFGRMPIL